MKCHLACLAAFAVLAAVEVNSQACRCCMALKLGSKAKLQDPAGDRAAGTHKPADVRVGGTDNNRTNDTDGNQQHHPAAPGQHDNKSHPHPAPNIHDGHIRNKTHNSLATQHHERQHVNNTTTEATHPAEKQQKPAVDGVHHPEVQKNEGLKEDEQQASILRLHQGSDDASDASESESASTSEEGGRTDAFSRRKRQCGCAGGRKKRQCGC